MVACIWVVLIRQHQNIMYNPIQNDCRRLIQYRYYDQLLEMCWGITILTIHWTRFYTCCGWLNRFLMVRENAAHHLNAEYEQWQ